MLTLLLIYLSIGFVWTVFMFILMMNDFVNTKEAIVCCVCNLFFWPLIMALAVAAGHCGRTFKGS